jgi:hypothetical protein
MLNDGVEQKIVLFFCEMHCMLLIFAAIYITFMLFNQSERKLNETYSHRHTNTHTLAFSHTRKVLLFTPRAYIRRRFGFEPELFGT